MLVVHKIEDAAIEGNAENPSFILTNKTGGYFSLSEWPVSRYQGAFFNEKGVFKAVSNIFPVDSGPVTRMTNNFHSIVRERANGKLNETLMMPLFHNSIVYELDRESEVEVVLDIRKAYDTKEFGRYYKIDEKEGKVMVEFTKKTDKKEDSTEGRTEYKVYVVISGAGGITRTERFFEETYDLDRRRNSWPWKRHVYSALRTNTKRLIISFSTNKKTALEENRKLERNLSEMKKKQAIYVNGFQKKIKDREKMMAYKAACLSLDHLVAIADRRKGVYAGLWWFFQFWSRDEAISLNALIQQGKYDVAKEILFKLLKSIGKDGRIPNIQPKAGGELESADAVGWVMKRMYDFFEGLFRKKIVAEYLSQEELEFIKNKVEDCIYNLIDRHTHDDLAYNGKKETWMDTAAGDDCREGYRIEIQALRLCTYKLMKLLCKVMKDRVGEDIAENIEKDLAERVRKDFWNGNYLDDGLKDSTIRPNVFIAYYIYPELLSASQWVKCFRNILPALWNEWGGLSSIDKKNRLYSPTHTGEDNRSYHRGDSWYWLNNLAAICMARLSRRKFSEYIEKIEEASTREILFSGAIGHHAEVSSSRQFESRGCLMQAWSSAMYIELINELH